MPLWEIGLLFFSVMIASFLLSQWLGREVGRSIRSKRISDENNGMIALAVIGNSCMPLVTLAYLRAGRGSGGWIILLALLAMATGTIGYFRGKQIGESAE